MVLPCTEMSPRWDLKFEWGLNFEYVRYEINFTLFKRIAITFPTKGSLKKKK